MPITLDEIQRRRFPGQMPRPSASDLPPQYQFARGALPRILDFINSPAPGDRSDPTYIPLETKYAMARDMGPEGLRQLASMPANAPDSPMTPLMNVLEQLRAGAPYPMLGNPGQRPTIDLRMGPRNPVNIVGPMSMPPGPGFTHFFNDSEGRPQAQVQEPDMRSYQEGLANIGQQLTALSGQGTAAQAALQQAALYNAAETARERMRNKSMLEREELEIKNAEKQAKQESQSMALAELLNDYANIQTLADSDMSRPENRKAIINRINQQALSDAQAGVSTVPQLLTQLSKGRKSSDELLQILAEADELPMKYRAWAAGERAMRRHKFLQDFNKARQAVVPQW